MPTNRVPRDTTPPSSTVSTISNDSSSDIDKSLSVPPGSISYSSSSNISTQDISDDFKQQFIDESDVIVTPSIKKMKFKPIETIQTVETTDQTPSVKTHTETTEAENNSKPVQIEENKSANLTKITPPKNPSLITPDFSGLYSVAPLGTTNRTRLNVFLGGVAIFTFIYSWLLGFFLPNLSLIFMLFQQYSAGTSLILFLSFLYILPFRPSTYICRLYVKYGAYWFHGGTSMSMEFDPENDDNLIYDKQDPRVIQSLEEERQMAKEADSVSVSNHSDDKQYQRPMMVTCNPHGIFCLGYFFCGGVRVQACTNRPDDEKLLICGKWSLNNSLFNRFARKGLVVGYLSKFPIFNTFITKLTGCVGSVDGINMKKIMINKESFGICPGGFDEATIFKKGENSVFLKERKGFVKYCLKYGPYEIKPCYIFGECDTYVNWTNWLGEKIKFLLNKYKIPTVFPIGPMWYCPLIYMPFRNIGLHCMLGKSIYVPRICEPNQNDIDKYHTMYANEVQRIFDDNKWRFGIKNDKLIVR